jgi:hypothetical protein
MKKHHWEVCDVLDMPHTSQVCPLYDAEMQCLLSFSVSQAFSSLVANMSAMELPASYQGESAVTLSVLAGSLATRLTSLVL